MKKRQHVLAVYMLLASCYVFAADMKTNHHDCDAIKTTLSKAIGSAIPVFQNEIEGFCVLSASGTGDILEKNNGDATFSRLVTKMTDQMKQKGWKTSEKTLEYAADGIKSTRFALEKNQSIAIIFVEEKANDDSKCPKDQPIDLHANCKLDAKDRYYLVQVLLHTN